MNILFEPFPDTITVSGKKYRIVTDFREWIKLNELLRQTERFTRHLLEMVLEWYIDEPPEDVGEAIKGLQRFLSAEDIYPQLIDGQLEETEDMPKKQEDVISFGQDAIFIYSAFREVYGIDIETIPYMHWWKFQALLNGLPSDTEIKERIYYRGLDLNEIDDKEERRRIKKIKKKIALKEPKRKLSDYQIGEMF